MKKIILGLFTLSTVAMAQEKTGFNINLLTGFDVLGRYSVAKINGVDINKNNADSIGGDIALEATQEIYPGLELGMGVAYQKHGKVEAADSSSKNQFDTDRIYDSVPIYTLVKYSLIKNDTSDYYLKGRFGYSVNLNEDDVKLKSEDKVKTNVDNGLYWGLGIGAEINNWIYEVMYHVNYADLETTAGNSRNKDNLDYSRVTISFGYQFNL